MPRIYSDEEADSLLKELYTQYQKGLGAISVVTWIASAIGTLGIGSAAWQYLQLRHNGVAIEKKLKDVEAAASAFLVPPGSVCAWPGALPLTDDPWWTNWRECDGGKHDLERKLSPVKYLGHEALQSVLNGLYGNDVASVLRPADPIKLPDFEGYFLRGAGGPASNIGILQKYGTAVPIMAPVEGDRTGENYFSVNDVLTVPSPQSGTVKCSLGALKGFWDAETRPANFAVHWVIRIK